MEDPRDIILGPIVSEKSYGAVKDNRYSFYVDLRAEKGEIKGLLKRFLMLKCLRLAPLT